MREVMSKDKLGLPITFFWDEDISFSIYWPATNLSYCCSFNFLSATDRLLSATRLFIKPVLTLSKLARPVAPSCICENTKDGFKSVPYFLAKSICALTSIASKPFPFLIFSTFSVTIFLTLLTAFLAISLFKASCSIPIESNISWMSLSLNISTNWFVSGSRILACFIWPIKFITSSSL